MWRLQLVPTETKVPFLRYRFFGIALSAVLLLGSAFFLTQRGLNFGIDFQGGILLELGFEQDADLPELRRKFASLDIGEVSIQTFGELSDVLVRIAQPETDENLDPLDDAQDTLEQDASDSEQTEDTNIVNHQIITSVRAMFADDNVTFRRVEVVGPQVSGELVRAGASAIIVAVILMLLYIWFRFEWQFSLGAVLALVHDVFITLGVFSYLQLSFDLSILAALLTIVGYSMNDTVVIYDRVRETLRKYKSVPLDQVLDLALNATLARTVMTSITTLLALFSLYFLGGEVIRGFTFAMIFGVVIGTYSSIFVACPLLHYLGVKRDWSVLAGTSMAQKP